MRRGLLVAIATAVLVGLLSVHADWMNGPWYWKWSWRADPPVARGAAAVLAGSVPLAIALVLWRRRSVGAPVAVALITISSLALQLSAARVPEPRSLLDRTAEVVLSTRATGYFDTAVRLQQGGSGWLARFPETSATDAVAPHAKSKPPGWEVYFAGMLRLVPGDDGALAAIAGGLLTALLAALSVPAMYLLVRYFARDSDAAVLGAAMIALAPAMIVWFPQFDPVYPALTCLWVVLWAMAIDHDRLRYAVAAGVVMASSLFLAYNLLVLGALLAGYALVAVRRGRIRARRVAILAGGAVGSIALFYTALRAATGFDALGSFAAALGNQAAMLEMTDAMLPRPYPQTILFDLTDFAMAGAWITLIPAGAWMLDRMRAQDWSDPFPIAALGIAQLILVAATHLLAAETFRVWIFMLPLVVLPAALELRKWAWRSAGLFLVCLGLLSATILSHMDFGP